MNSEDRRRMAVRIAAVGLGAAATLTAIGRLRTSGRGDTGSAESAQRWMTVTINAAPDVVMPGTELPGPLADLGLDIEVETTVAPGGRGTELRARLRTPAPDGASGPAARASGDDPRQQVRSALRDAKQLIEAGEVLRVDPVPHGQRPSTPQGKVLDFIAQRSHGEGLV